MLFNIFLVVRTHKQSPNGIIALLWAGTATLQSDVRQVTHGYCYYTPGQDMVIVAVEFRPP